MQDLRAAPTTISIHALRGEGDTKSCERTTGLSYFYPRPPWGGRPRHNLSHQEVTIFLSTPSVGRATVMDAKQALSYGNFYPRPPWGGRLKNAEDLLDELIFLSTPSVGRATYPLCRDQQNGRISIHALRGEGDLRRVVDIRIVGVISIHALRGEGDRGHPAVDFPLGDFYPRPPWGGRPTTALRGSAR